MSKHTKLPALLLFLLLTTLAIVNLVPSQALAQPLLPPEASTVASDIDSIFWVILVITAFFFFLVFILLIYFMIKYRAKQPNEEGIHFHGHMGLEIAWTIVPAVIFIVIAIWSGIVLTNLDNPPEDAMVIGVEGFQFGWNFTYPANNADGMITSTNELHIPVNEPIKLEIVSQDVLHSFWVPAFRLKQDALPDQIRNLWFEATLEGTYPVICAELCGAGHSAMLAKVVVEERNAYDAWIEEQVQMGSDRGRVLAQQNGCLGCHSVDGSESLGPTWLDLFGATETLDDGTTVEVDDAYLIQSIRDPNSQVVEGFQAGLMQPYSADQISDNDVQQIVDYIRSLTSNGDTTGQTEDGENGDGDGDADDSTTGDGEGGGEVDMVTRGQQLAQANGCLGCHTADGSEIVGPTWLGLYGSMEQIQGMDEPIEVDDEYLIESIREPNAKIVEGFNANMMIAYGPNQLSDDDIQAIIAYIQSLEE